MLLEKEYFDIWMRRIMDVLERIERNQKPPKAPEYPTTEDGERLYDNQSNESTVPIVSPRSLSLFTRTPMYPTMNCRLSDTMSLYTRHRGS